MSLDIHRNYDASQLHTLRLDAVARTYAEVSSEAGVLEAIARSKFKREKLVPIGEGSNLVFPHTSSIFWLGVRIPGLVVIDEGENHLLIRVGAGENWHKLVEYCVEKDWYGLENLALIPGQVGAAPIQNIGAYGVEVADRVKLVSGIQISTGKGFELSGEECEFGYRDSVFKHRLLDDCIITSVQFRLDRHFTPCLSYPGLREILQSESPGTASEIQKPVTAKEVFGAVVQLRRSKLPDPSRFPNAGSFFKNPLISEQAFQEFKKRIPEAPYFASEQGYKLSAAWLIEHAGLKGFSCNGLKMSGKHALVLQHDPDWQGGASTSQDVSDFSSKVSSAVKADSGIKLDPEPRFY